MFPLRLYNNTPAAPIFVNALRINDWKYCNLKLFEISVFRGRPFKSLYNHVPSAGCISYFFPQIVYLLRKLFC